MLVLAQGTGELIPDSRHQKCPHTRSELLQAEDYYTVLPLSHCEWEWDIHTSVVKQVTPENPCWEDWYFVLFKVFKPEDLLTRLTLLEVNSFVKAITVLTPLKE